MNFEETVVKAEQSARNNMGLYKFKLFLYGVLGYVVIFGLLILLVAILGGLAFASVKSTALLIVLAKSKVLFVLIPVIWVMLTALWVTLDPPQGFTAKKDQFPELFEAIDAIRAELSAPKVHEVLLTPELNASISQTPRLGIFGWNKNTLTLGLELLLLLSPQQAASVIAHELGHLSGNHARFNGWIYRIRQSWFRIMQAFEERSGFGVGMMRRFFDWYAPNFSAYSFALARANEYEADAMAAELTDPQTAGEALIKAYVSGEHTEENYWQKFFMKADEQPEPDHLPFEGLCEWMRQETVAHEDIARRLEQALEKQTDYTDTHPCLNDRLSALNVEPSVPAASTSTAARAWLGEQYDSVIGHFDQEWVTAIGDNWRQRFEYATESKKTLATLSDQDSDTLGDDELWQKAVLTEEFVDPEKAVFMYRAYQQRHPSNAAVAFSIGRLVFEKNDHELLEQMKIAAEDPDYVIIASQYAHATLQKLNRTEEAQWWLDQAQQQSRINQLAYQERIELNERDDIADAELSDAASNHLVEQLRRIPKVDHAWVARKVVKYRTDETVLAIAIKVGGMTLDVEGFAQTLSQHVEIEGNYFLVPDKGNFKKLAKKIRKFGHQLF